MDMEINYLINSIFGKCYVYILLSNKQKINILNDAYTSHNRSVYVPPPVGRLQGSVKPQSG
jgi:hypothetical protein